MSDSLPEVVPPLPHPNIWRRDLPATMAFAWLKAGLHDLARGPAISLAYGLLVLVLSLCIVGGLFYLRMDYILFPALAGFMVVGPALAIGLYEKSRRLETGEPVHLSEMIFVHPRSGVTQIFFTGALLCLLMLVWMRAAVLIYALFFGLLPFPGLEQVTTILFGTPEGLAMLVVGGLVGALFAAFSFAIGAVSVPILLREHSDALTAMGTSLALVANNLPVMLVWGAIVLCGFLLCVATGLLAIVVVFPVLGHSTWHVYRALRRD